MPSAEFSTWVGELVRRHRAGLLRSAVALGLQPDEALDVVQDAFAIFLSRPEWRALPRHTPDAERLLGALVRNTARTHRRRPHRRHQALEDDPVEEIVEVAPLPDALLAEAEEHHRLTGCVATLKEMQRAVVVARLFEGDSGLEAASRLGMTPRNVAVVLHRARKRLEACLAESRARAA